MKEADWNAGQWLAKLMEEERLKQLVGENTKVLMLVSIKFFQHLAPYKCPSVSFVKASMVCCQVAQEVAQFGIGMTIVEPGGARTEFRYGSAKVANLMPEYDSCHGFLNMLDKSKGLAVGDPVKMAQRIIESAEKTPAPLRMVLGSQALSATIERLEERVADYKTQTTLAASTDIQ